VIGMLQAIIGDMISLVAVLAILGGIIKLFQIATSLNEIKDLLIEMKRNAREVPPSVSGVPSYSAASPRGALANRSGAEALQAALLDPEP
jgi:hypothetical protein